MAFQLKKINYNIFIFKKIVSNRNWIRYALLTNCRDKTCIYTRSYWYSYNLLEGHLKLGIFYRVRLPLAISLFSLFYFRELLIIYLIALICRLVGEKRPLLFISIKAETVTEKIVVLIASSSLFNCHATSFALIVRCEYMDGQS